MKFKMAAMEPLFCFIFVDKSSRTNCTEGHVWRTIKNAQICLKVPEY